MRIHEWLDSSVGSPLSEQDITSAERALGCRLPQDYRDFLKLYNGGYLKNNYLPVHTTRGRAWVVNVALQALVPSAGSRDVDIVSMQPEWMACIPSDCIVIGDPEGDCGIVMYVRGNRCGQVWIKSVNDDNNKPESGMYYCAESFTAMMKLLQTGSPGSEAQYID